MKYQAASAFHAKMQRPFLDGPNKPTTKQAKALSAIRQRHPELEAKL